VLIVAAADTVQRGVFLVELLRAWGAAGEGGVVDGGVR
jgi:hypothetical protein